MKKSILILGSLIASAMFAGNPDIRQSYSGAREPEGYQFISLEMNGVTIPTSTATTWYGDNIAGFSKIKIFGLAVSSGSTPTTISAQAMLSNGMPVGSAQTITSGTDLTDIRSPYYKFTLPAYSAPRRVSFNFVIAD